MQQYLHAKRAVQQSFIDHGATLSHHHAVGTEHLPWLTDDISPVGVMAVAAIKGGLDPGNVMNPGRLRPSTSSFEEWSRVGSDATDPIPTYCPIMSENPIVTNSLPRTNINSLQTNTRVRTDPNRARSID
jgi:hypothetical protein